MTIFTKTDKPIVRIYPLPFNPDEYADDSEFTRSIIIKLIFGGLRMNRMNRPKKIESLKKMDFQSYYREPLYESEVMSFRHIIRVKGSILSIQNGGKLND